MKRGLMRGLALLISLTAAQSDTTTNTTAVEQPPTVNTTESAEPNPKPVENTEETEPEALHYEAVSQWGEIEPNCVGATCASECLVL